MNVIAWLKYELAYFQAAVEHCINYGLETFPIKNPYFLSMKLDNIDAVHLKE